MSNAYVLEKYLAAIDALIGDGSIQERLTFAADSLLRIPANEDFPDVALGDRHRAVMAKLTTSPLSDQSGYKRRPLSKEEGNAIAKEILSIYVSLSDDI